MKNQIPNLVRFFVLLGIVSLACGISVDMGNQMPASAPVQPTQPPPPYTDSTNTYTPNRGTSTNECAGSADRGSALANA